MTPKTHTFCVDATNVVRRAYGYGGPQFRAQEDSDAQRLIEGLSGLCSRRGSLVEVDVVFDGAWRQTRAALPSNLRVRFAPESGADDMILDRVRALRHAGSRVTVITGDADLGALVQEEGGRLLRPHSDAIEGVLSAIEARLRP